MVVERKNLRAGEIKEAIQQFNDSLGEKDVAVFFFSGHGAQIHGVNYLIPAFFDGIRESEIKSETYNLQELVDQLEGRKGISIAFLDACRSGDNIIRDLTRGPKIVGLAAPELTEGLLVEFATSGGHVAYDGDGHGAFTSALLRHLGTPNEPVEVTMKAVAKEVRDETKNRKDDEQVPYAYGRIIDDFCFSGDACGASEVRQLSIAHWREQHAIRGADVYVTTAMQLPDREHSGPLRAWVDRLVAAYESSKHGAGPHLPRERLGPYADSHYHDGREYIAIGPGSGPITGLKPSGEAESVPDALFFHTRLGVFTSGERSVHLMVESFTSEPIATNCVVYFSNDHPGMPEQVESTMEGKALFHPIAGQFADWLDFYGATLIVRDMNLYLVADDIKKGFSFIDFQLNAVNGNWFPSLALFPQAMKELFTDDSMSLIVQQADWNVLREVPRDYPGPRRAEFGPLPSLQ